MSSRGHASDKMKYVPDSLRWLIAITGVLIVIGCLNIYSSTYYMDIYDGGSAYKHISNHILFLLGGIFAAWIAVKLGTNKIRQGAWLWFIAVFLLLILVKFAGISVNGANRWIMLGPMSLQPSELAKVAGIIWTAAFLAKRINNKEPITVFYGILNRPMGKRRKRRGLSIIFCRYYVLRFWQRLFCSNLTWERRLLSFFSGTALYSCGDSVFGNLGRNCDGSLSWGISGCCFCLSRGAYGYIMGSVCRSFGGGISDCTEFNRSRFRWILGAGTGEGVYKFLYLPEQHTDFAYAVFSQEFGFIGSVVVMCLFMGFLMCGFSCARQLKQPYESLLVYGLTLLISVQGIINMAMVIGCFPVTGIPLPFISYGGTSLLTNVISVGLIWGAVISGRERAI